MAYSIVVVACSVLNIAAVTALARGWTAPTRRWAALVAALCALGCMAAGAIGYTTTQVTVYQAVAVADPSTKASMLSTGIAQSFEVALVGLVGMVLPTGAVLALLLAPRTGGNEPRVG